MNRLLVALVAFAIGFSMASSNVAYERRKQERAILDDKWDEYQEKHVQNGRIVDIGVRLRCVVQDLGLLGQELLPGKPRVRVVDGKDRVLGGMLDRKRRCLVGFTRNPVSWFCSEDQWDVILHERSELPLGLLVYGSEGAGKTTALAMWHYCRWLEHLGEGREGGQTAPTRERLTMVLAEIEKLWPARWYKHIKSKNLLRLCDGNARTCTKIRFRATKQQSKDTGSPIQGWSWSWCGRDEIQDQIERHSDIENRGRAARDGRYKQLGTATAKDTSEWRAFRDLLTTAAPELAADWVKLTLLGVRSPFVHPSFWAAKARTMSTREYQRRVLARDVPPELAVYYAWLRERDPDQPDRAPNLVRYPQIALDVTPAILIDYRSYCVETARFVILAGHDPGVIYNTTTFHRMLMFGDVPTWVVVGEVRTKQKTQGVHARAVKTYCREKFGIERGERPKEKVLFFVDPHGKGVKQTDYQSVYMAFQKENLDVFSPAPTTGVIHRAPRVEMMNRLMCSADNVVRYVVATDDYGQPAAPVLVAALESLEKREGDDSPEGEHAKDETDQTHAPVSSGYALWMFEQEAFTDETLRKAVVESQRIRFS